MFNTFTQKYMLNSLTCFRCHCSDPSVRPCANSGGCGNTEVIVGVRQQLLHNGRTDRSHNNGSGVGIVVGMRLCQDSVEHNDTIWSEGRGPGERDRAGVQHRHLQAGRSISRN